MEEHWHKKQSNKNLVAFGPPVTTNRKIKPCIFSIFIQLISQFLILFTQKNTVFWNIYYVSAKNHTTNNPSLYHTSNYITKTKQQKNTQFIICQKNKFDKLVWYHIFFYSFLISFESSFSSSFSILISSSIAVSLFKCFLTTDFMTEIASFTAW